MPEEKSETWQLEESNNLQLDFHKLEKAVGQSKGILPVAVQDATSKEVILIAYTNETAFKKSIETRIATFWSTSRNELWIKGQTSGHYFELLEIRVNCEQNSLVYIVRPKGEGICHTRNAQGKARNCYYRRLDMQTGSLINLDP
jgi:phosphoribosyl-AMP cyclohydrolase